MATCQFAVSAMAQLSLPLFALFLVKIGAAQDIADLGVTDWNCPDEDIRRSRAVPTNVNSVRFADIDVIGALGDSLTAGYGAGRGLQVDSVEYRGEVFSIGGDRSLQEHVTVANILKELNENLFGFSIGTGKASKFRQSMFNVAEPSAGSADLLSQAMELVQRMKRFTKVNMAKSWKLVHIFVGTNDICDQCDSANFRKSSQIAAEKHRDNIREALAYLREHMPRTIVVLTGSVDLSVLRQFVRSNTRCDAYANATCGCFSKEALTDNDLSTLSRSFMRMEQNIQYSGEFDSDEFTFVVQPFLAGLKEFPTTTKGGVEVDVLSADCFHFSRYGHALAGRNLWNNLVQAVGQKTTTADLTENGTLLCPDTNCPFVRTRKNSANCRRYLNGL